MSLDGLHFLQKVQECVKEYRKQLNDTRDEADAAHFYNSSLRTFIHKHQKEFGILATMNFEKPFLSWMKTYLLKK